MATFAALKGETLSHTTLITLIYSEAEMLGLIPSWLITGESVPVRGGEVLSPFTHNMAMANCMPRLLGSSYEKSEPLCRCEVSYKPLTKREGGVGPLGPKATQLKR